MLNSGALLQNNSLIYIQHAKDFCYHILNFTSIISKKDQEALLDLLPKVINFHVVNFLVGATNK